ncbi:hypothetical protein RvY_14987 [Ramazzottius varieornatus]|uniref:Uncharacterized protein n=1 Tax=Ramazzottius varieornatus TaxID=947166 RepID=A0A1D1VT86_RAMVA|nr:hypothetical protein RvY_14987 [Ramazzottius varieornatus]
MGRKLSHCDPIIKDTQNIMSRQNFLTSPKKEAHETDGYYRITADNESPAEALSPPGKTFHLKRA